MMSANRKILLVEDEAIIAMSLSLELSKAGYFVDHIISTGEEAIALVDSEPPDLILMDVHLGGILDGIETAQQIQAEHKIPVIFMTGYEETEIQKRSQHIDLNALIKKPVKIDELLKVIEAL